MINKKAAYKRFLILPRGQKFRALEKLAVLVFSSLLVRFVPLRFYYNQLLAGREGAGSIEKQPLVNEIRQYNRLIRLVPWKVTCLMESLAFSIYFKRKGIFVPVHLGVKPGEHPAAHAWNFESGAQGFSAIKK
jgi:hypothetical protein